MGVVYRGRYVENDRQVAVKMLSDDIADAKLFARFERELEILKTLRHPHIVHCFGGVCEDERRFYAMEYVDGGTLSGLMKDLGPLSWQETIDNSLQICSALAYAHKAGVVHRDIKPSNFLITKTGKLKLSDFGLATVTAARKITSPGMTVGSFRYMAPEQIRGQAVSPQTDLYALGCVMFQMLAGRPPFDGETSAEILHQHVKQQPPRVRMFVERCPAALDALIDSLLQKDPLQRPSGAVAVAERLKDISSTSPADVRMTGSSVAKQPVVASTKGYAPSSSWLNSQLLFSGCVLLIVLLLFWNFSLRSDLNAAQQKTLEAVRGGLSDNDPKARRVMLRALERMGAAATPAIPQVRNLQKSDPDQLVREQADQALRKIQKAESQESGWFFASIVVIVGVGGAGLYLLRRFGLLDFLDGNS